MKENDLPLLRFIRAILSSLETQSLEAGCVSRIMVARGLLDHMLARDVRYLIDEVRKLCVI